MISSLMPLILEIELNACGRDRSGDLEIHVAVMIFIPMMSVRVIQSSAFLHQTTEMPATGW